MAPKPFNFPAKRRTVLFLLTATAAAAAARASNSDELSTFPAFSADRIGAEIRGLVRTARAVSTVASTVVDYEFSLRGLQRHSDQYRQAISQVHLRSAERFLKLCEANKGFYVKAGQFVASQKVLPREYSSTLSALQDQVAPLPFKVIEQVLKDNLGPDFSEMFLSIDKQPIAAASIAQVHHAVLKSGHEVAIKVQYPWIEQQMNFDTRTMYFLSKTVARLYPQYRLEWLPLVFAKSLSSELDFVQEARNSERAAKNFRNNKMVRIPHVFWELTTKQVLTMQFCTGHKVDDIDFLNQIGVDPQKVANSLIELFAEMIFVHGYIHDDPHPGNILVSPGGCNGFTLVLLDHAVYRELDEEFRKDFCQLWEALILNDSEKTLWLGERFGAGKYSRYLPIIFTGKTIESKYAFGMSIEEKETMKHELKSLLFEDLSSFMESLPPDFIAIMRVDALLRSIIRKMDVSRVIRLLTYTKYAVYGRLCPKLDGESCKMTRTNFCFKRGKYLHKPSAPDLDALVESTRFTQVFLMKRSERFLVSMRLFSMYYREECKCLQNEISLVLLFMPPDFAVKAYFFSFISTLKYHHILMKVLIGAIDGTPWRQKVKNVSNYLYSKISSDFWEHLVHSVFILLCMRPNPLI